MDAGEVLVMRMTISGRGVSSGVPAGMRISAVARLDPFIVDYRNFFDDADALRYAGLAPRASGWAAASLRLVSIAGDHVTDELQIAA